MQRNSNDSSAADLKFEEIFVPGYKKVIRVTSDQANLNAIICIHSTVLGPALGGARIYPYETFEEALRDALRLAKSMTYKAAVAGCNLGGGKSVIIADFKKNKTKEMLLAFGHAVDRLQGQYICATDVGCTQADISVIRQVTPYVVGLSDQKSSGNPTPFTAWGTYRGIQSVLKKIYGTDSPENKTIAIQGLGNVGSKLAELLFWAGARLIVSDVDVDKCGEVANLTGAQIAVPGEIIQFQCDVLAPCALGGIINSQTIPNLKCKAIAGCANNQLLEDSDADALLARGILYAPDFVINAGGLINVAQELSSEGYHPVTVRNKTHCLYDQLMEIYEIAEHSHCSTHQAALSLAESRLKYGTDTRLDSSAVS